MEKYANNFQPQMAPVISNMTNNSLNAIEAEQTIDNSINYDMPSSDFNYTANIEVSGFNHCHGNRREMANEIKELNFSIIDIELYLDTHPEDQKALCLHKGYCRKLKDLKDKYEKVYGSLSIYCPCNKWRWIEEPWGAFRLEVNYLSIETVRTSCC